MTKYQRILVALFAVAAGLATTASAFAQSLGDYSNLTATRTLTFANLLTGSMYDQVSGFVPFVIQIGLVLIVLVLVLAIPTVIIGKLSGWMHRK
jgi:glucan phosphoethanolaminetransferase (alkaline phosphatase superfamily)